MRAPVVVFLKTPLCCSPAPIRQYREYSLGNMVRPQEHVLQVVCTQANAQKILYRPFSLRVWGKSRAHSSAARVETQRSAVRVA